MRAKPTPVDRSSVFSRKSAPESWAGRTPVADAASAWHWSAASASVTTPASWLAQSVTHARARHKKHEKRVPHSEGAVVVHAKVEI